MESSVDLLSVRWKFDTAQAYSDQDEDMGEPITNHGYSDKHDDENEEHNIGFQEEESLHVHLAMPFNEV